MHSTPSQRRASVWSAGSSISPRPRRRLRRRRTIAPTQPPLLTALAVAVAAVAAVVLAPPSPTPPVRSLLPASFLPVPIAAFPGSGEDILRDLVRASMGEEAGGRALFSNAAESSSLANVGGGSGTGGIIALLIRDPLDSLLARFEATTASAASSPSSGIGGSVRRSEWVEYRDAHFDSHLEGWVRHLRLWADRCLAAGAAGSETEQGSFRPCLLVRYEDAVNPTLGPAVLWEAVRFLGESRPPPWSADLMAERKGGAYCAWFRVADGGPVCGKSKKRVPTAVRDNVAWDWLYRRPTFGREHAQRLGGIFDELRWDYRGRCAELEWALGRYGYVGAAAGESMKGSWSKA